MKKTLDDLKAAFAGESQANRKYLAYAQKADSEGYPQAARLFRAAAEAETIHAHNHLRAMEGIGSTAENLKDAIAGENYEHTQMYPAFLKDAKEEEQTKAIKSFDFAMSVEVEHEALYQEALDTLGKSDESYDYYICPVCGHTHARNAPDKCPICGAPASRFIKIS